MRVLTVVKTNTGARWALEQAIALKQCGVEITAVLPQAQGGCAEEYRAAGIPVIGADLSLPVTRPWLLFGRIALVRRLVRQQKPDLLHCHFVTNIMMLRIALRRSPTLRIFQVPGPLHLEHALTSRTELALATRQDYWAPACQKSRRIYQKAGVPDKRLFLCYYGGYGDRAAQYAPPQSILHEQYRLPPETRLVGMVSYFYRPRRMLLQLRGIKGHEDFIRAVAELLLQHPDVTGVIIGGPWGNAKRYQKKMARLARRLCGGRMIFTGHREDLDKIYRELAVAVHPSLSENLGGAAESLAAGVPTVATDVGGLPDIVIDGQTGLLCPPHDPPALANCIGRMLDDSKAAQDMAQRGKELVRVKLGTGRCAERVLSMYQSILDDEKAGREPPEGQSLSAEEYRPLVSIVIPVYNGADYLREAIESALNQTYANIEVIVVNDGSNDNCATYRIAQEYGNRITFIDKSNGGVSSALNAGIAAMKGQWFSWLSHDDLYEPDKIGQQIALINRLMRLEPSINPERLVITCNTALIDSGGQIIRRVRSPGGKNNRKLILRNMKKNHFGGCAFLLPRACFDDVGLFNEELRTVSDYEYWFRLLLGGYRFEGLSQYLVKGRVHKNQVTHRSSLLANRELDKLYLWLTRRMYKNEEYRKPMNFMLAGSYARRRRLQKSAKKAFCYAAALMPAPLYRLTAPPVKLWSDLLYACRSVLKRVFYSVAFGTPQAKDEEEAPNKTQGG